MKKTTNEIYDHLNYQFDLCLNSMVSASKKHNLESVQWYHHELTAYVRCCVIFGEIESEEMCDIDWSLNKTMARIWEEFN